MDYISFQLFTIDWAILHVYNAFTQKNEKKNGAEKWHGFRQGDYVSIDAVKRLYLAWWFSFICRVISCENEPTIHIT